MRKPRLDDFPPPLPGCFFERDTLQVARDMLGTCLIRPHPQNGQPEAFRVVETEAYTEDDPACHAYGKKTGRAAMLYERPGLAYVYLIYGMYDCLNVVTMPKGIAGAVLFRALEPPPDTDYRTHGPGRLTKALNITRDQHNGIDLTDAVSPWYLAPGTPASDEQVIQTTRIGITKAAEHPWRFYVDGNPWVSVKARPAKGAPLGKKTR